MVETGVFPNGNIKINLLPAINNLSVTLSKYKEGILTLGENWDDDGGKPYQITTWDRAESFVGELLIRLWLDNIIVPIPSILPGPGGSIDVDWETDAFKLLVNVPEDPTELVNLFGEGVK